MSELTQKRLHELLDYNHETGVFLWRASPAMCIKDGSAAGTKTKTRTGHVYLRIQIDGKLYRAHRLAFLYMTGRFPENHVDHKDRNTLNNRWGNLRTATGAQNVANSKARSDNVSGLKGVSFTPETGRYRAAIRVDGKGVHLGYHATAEEAHAAYCRAAKRHFGEFMNNGVHVATDSKTKAVARARPCRSLDKGKEIAALRKDGKTYKEIGDLVGLSPTTVLRRLRLMGIGK